MTCSCDVKHDDPATVLVEKYLILQSLGLQGQSVGLDLAGQRADTKLGQDASKNLSPDNCGCGGGLRPGTG